MPAVLVLGSGGREHALAWRLSQSSLVDKVFLAPVNGCAFPTAPLDPTNPEEIVAFARDNLVDLVVVGPEAYLAAGIVDDIADRVAVFGPGKHAAKLETSKIFAKEFMQEFNLPTADFCAFKDVNAAEEYIESCQWKVIVVKADGLAAGKGVVVATSKAEAMEAARSMLQGHFDEILIEEGLSGYEVSALCFTDGETFARMPLIRDHKRLLEGDKGPNTGGMGVVGPVEVPEETDRQIDHILRRTVEGLRKRGIVYRGVIYAGLMVTPTGPKLLEYNCRFGDPETELIMRSLAPSSDLYVICQNCVKGTLSALPEIQWDSRPGCGIVLSSKDYPVKGDKGTEITDIPFETEDTVVFHCGTAKQGDKTVTNGGRILCVTALGSTPEEARQKAIRAADQVKFEGKFYRRDIGVVKRDLQSSITYGDSGVDVAEGNAFVEGIKGLVKSTLLPGTSQIGGFGALVDFKEAGYSTGSQIVVGIDGVGTKIEIADVMGDYSGIGQDCVAMCVNDVLCHCAKPIAFLDYFVTGALDRKMATEVVASITSACKRIRCSLIGGETAEMPGVYLPKQWDLAGCAIAVREPSWPSLPDPDRMTQGDLLIGLRSSGVHSNGFSLVRKIMSLNKISYKDPTPWDPTTTFGAALLAPTRLYVQSVFPLLRDGLVSGCAHITGGGIKENAVRILDSKGSVAMEVDGSSWEKLPLFDWLASMGPVEDLEMLTAFNCGIGMVLVVNPSNSEIVLERLRRTGEEPVVIGRLVEREGDSLIRFVNLEKTFNRSLYSIKRTSRRIKVGILISGTGTNMVNLVKRTRRPDSNCEVAIVVSNKHGVKGLTAAEELGIPTAVVPHTAVREEGEREMTARLKEAGVELICLAGYMRLLTEEFVNTWHSRIINVHPSLLPSFKGAHAVEDALQFGAKVTGCTVHFVASLMDHGDVIAQAAVPIDDADDESTLHVKIQQEEYRLFPEAMEKVARTLLSTNQ